MNSISVYHKTNLISNFITDPVSNFIKTFRNNLNKLFIYIISSFPSPSSSFLPSVASSPSWDDSVESTEVKFSNKMSLFVKVPTLDTMKDILKKNGYYKETEVKSSTTTINLNDEEGEEGKGTDHKKN